MDKNRIRGAGERGERASDREAPVTKGTLRKSGGRAVKVGVLTWGNLVSGLKGSRGRTPGNGRDSAFRGWPSDLNPSNRPVRTRMPGGVAREPESTTRAHYADSPSRPSATRCWIHAAVGRCTRPTLPAGSLRSSPLCAGPRPVRNANPGSAQRRWASAPASATSQRATAHRTVRPANQESVIAATAVGDAGSTVRVSVSAASRSSRSGAASAAHERPEQDHQDPCRPPHRSCNPNPRATNRSKAPSGKGYSRLCHQTWYTEDSRRSRASRLIVGARMNQRGDWSNVDAVP